MKRFAKAIYWLRFDALWLGGLAAIGYGTHEVHPPTAYITVGAALLIIGILRSGTDGPIGDEDHPEGNGDS